MRWLKRIIKSIKANLEFRRIQKIVNQPWNMVIVGNSVGIGSSFCTDLSKTPTSIVVKGHVIIDESADFIEPPYSKIPVGK